MKVAIPQEMEVAKSQWELVDLHEKLSEMGKDICQSKLSFQQIVDVKTLLSVVAILLKHSHNSNHAKAQLECAQLLLESIPSCIALELKCRAFSMLSECYHLTGATASQKRVLNKGLELTAPSVDRSSGRLWFCNFNSQLANALIMEGDYQGSITALEQGYICAEDMRYPALQMFFASSVLHVHLMQWDNTSLAEEAFKRCGIVWKSLEHEKTQHCTSLMLYKDLLHVFYLLRICNYKTAARIAKRLDSALKSDIEQTGYMQVLRKEFEVLNASVSCDDLSYRDRSALTRKHGELMEQIADYTRQVSANKDSAYFGNTSRAWNDKLELAPPPIDGHWLPKRAVVALLDLVFIVFSRPKGLFEEFEDRIRTEMQTIREEMAKLGINNGAKEVDLQHTTIWMAGVYLTHIMHFLENKVAADLTRAGFAEAQLGLLRVGNWNVRFPTILQACRSTIEMLSGQYAHSVGSYLEASKDVDVDDEMGVDLADERIARLEESSETSILGVRFNDDVVFAADRRSMLVLFGEVTEDDCIKAHTLYKDMFALGSGRSCNVLKVCREMRESTKHETFQDAKDFALKMAGLADKANLYGDVGEISLIVIGRADIDSPAKIYSVAVREHDSGARNYECGGEEGVFGLTFTAKGSGEPFMLNCKSWPHMSERLKTLREGKKPDEYVDSLMKYVLDVIAEPKRWDYYTDGDILIVALCKSQEAIFRTAEPADKKNPFSGYGPLQETQVRPRYWAEVEAAAAAARATKATKASENGNRKLKRKRN